MGFDGDLDLTWESQNQLLTRRRDARDRFEFGLELGDGPRGGNAPFGGDIGRQYQEGNVTHGLRASHAGCAFTTDRLRSLVEELRKEKFMIEQKCVMDGQETG